MTAETARFRAGCPRSAALAADLSAHWLGGAPMHWMTDWPTPFPLVVDHAAGATVTDIDGSKYDDFCLGDTPAMFGHAPPALNAAVATQMQKGAGFMLPTALAEEVGALLAARFGLAFWQATLTASDANRALIRWARAVTGRTRVVVFDGCYHGMVDDAFVTLAPDGRTRMKPGLVGQVYDLSDHSTAIAFNDVAALEETLARGDVACVLAEPVMTNCGMILPAAGFHDALRALTRRHGALLILDETHTLSAGPSGATGEMGLEPDALVIGKAIGGGAPAAAWGVSEDLARRIGEAARRIGAGQSGIGTTLAGNALSLAAMRAMLGAVMTEQAYAHMREGAGRLADGLRGVIARRGLPWCVAAAGARVELVFAPAPPRDAAAMRMALGGGELSRALNLFLINRRVLIAPFHSMMLISPVTGDDQIDRLIAAVDAFAAALDQEDP